MTPLASATPGSSPPTSTAAPATSSPAAWQQRPQDAAGPSARADHTWTVDGDDTFAYLFGGRDSSGLTAELWRYDLAADSWSLLAPAGAVPAARFGHTATWVPGVGLVVWSGQGSQFFNDIWAYDPAANAWHPLPFTGAVPEARYGSCASLGPDARLWISHGFTQDDGRFADTRAYDFATGEWTDMTPAGEHPVKRCLHDCFWSADGQKLILYGGQTTGTPALGDIWAYDLASGAWQSEPDPLAADRQLYALAVVDGGALVFGGGSLDGGYLNDAWTIDSASFVVLSPFSAGSPPPARSAATMISDLARGRVLLFGGEGADGLLGDTWELSPI